MDEFVQVITGSLTFTSDKGEVHEFGRMIASIRPSNPPRDLRA